MHSESLRSNGTLTLHYLLRQILYIIIKWTHTHTHSPPTTDWCKQLNILLFQWSLRGKQLNLPLFHISVRCKQLIILLFHIRVRDKRLNITLIQRSFKCKQLNILLFQFSIRCKQLNMLLFQARAVSQYFYQYILWTWEIWISIFLYTYTDNGVISVLYIFFVQRSKDKQYFFDKRRYNKSWRLWDFQNAWLSKQWSADSSWNTVLH